MVGKLKFEELKTEELVLGWFKWSSTTLDARNWEGGYEDGYGDNQGGYGKGGINAEGAGGSLTGGKRVSSGMFQGNNAQ